MVLEIKSPFPLIRDSQNEICQHLQSNNAVLQELPLWERPYSNSRVIKMQTFFPESDSKSLNNNVHTSAMGMFDYCNQDVTIMPCKIGHKRHTLEQDYQWREKAHHKKSTWKKICVSVTDPLSHAAHCSCFQWTLAGALQGFTTLAQDNQFEYWNTALKLSKQNQTDRHNEIKCVFESHTLKLPELDRVVVLYHQTELKYMGRRQMTNTHSKSRLNLKEDRLTITILQTEGCADG